MAYVAKPKGSAEGLYRFLADAEDAFYEQWLAFQRRRLENGYSAEAYPRQRRLDAFAVGAAVNVAAGELLGWCAKEAGAPHVQRPSGRVPARVIVAADDSLVFTDVEWVSLFVEENGL